MPLPIIEQFRQIKKDCADKLLFFRIGDFYELFEHDAIIASRELDLVLTSRGKDEMRVPMCGFPHHSSAVYIKKLVDRGYKVAVCDQIGTGGKMMAREITKSYTAGTLIDPEFIDEKNPNILACIFYDGKKYGVAWTDISTGVVNIDEFLVRDIARLLDLLIKIAPNEIICNSLLAEELSNLKLSPLLPELCVGASLNYEYMDSLSKLTKKEQEQFNSFKWGVCALGGMIDYINKMNNSKCALNLKVAPFSSAEYMQVDHSTLRNLEIFEPCGHDERGATLLKCIDLTVTAVGARTLREWVKFPLNNIKKINLRLNSVEWLVKNGATRESIVDLLKDFRDLARVNSKINRGTAELRDLQKVFKCITVLPKIKEALHDSEDAFLAGIRNRIANFDEAHKLLSSALELDEGEEVRFRAGYDKYLDDMVHMIADFSEKIRMLEKFERIESGIKTLKIKNNLSIGYFFEIDKAFEMQVPYRYRRKGLAKDSLRFTSEELEEFEQGLKWASEEYEKTFSGLFDNLVGRIRKYSEAFNESAIAIGALDAVVSFASVAVLRGYCRPVFELGSDVIEIKSGRHATVERFVDVFVPNDCYMDGSENRTYLITAPNMAGKSTFMRQTALILYMAHIGCFVPAVSCRCGVVDKIFTRVGASDNIAKGYSTFMTEMSEVAHILEGATKDSFVVLDEVGRGTGVNEGMSIAWAVLESLNDRMGARTMFATHFHRLTELEKEGNGIKNYCFSAITSPSKVEFSHKIQRGATALSFGIVVASLAGVPNDVIMRAREIFDDLEREKTGK